MRSPSFTPLIPPTRLLCSSRHDPQPQLDYSSSCRETNCFSDLHLERRSHQYSPIISSRRRTHGLAKLRCCFAAGRGRCPGSWYSCKSHPILAFHTNGRSLTSRICRGDGACGKTSLLNVFTRGYFPTVYEPTVFENYVHDIFLDNTHVELSLWDTAGQEEFDRLRSLSYDNTHAIMLCFSVRSIQVDLVEKC